MTADLDAKWMRRCLALARRAEGFTAPNPMVGCVIVSARGALLAEGWHRRAGAPHGEAAALAKLGGKAKGATLYVNLEPCNHQGRTPPCAPSVLASGVRRVVIGAMDPIEGHGGGAKLLKKGGVEVVTGVLRDECEALNRGFFSVARRGRPFVTLKVATSLDGKAATHTGDSKWITSEQARADGHALRGKVDAILVGVGTVLADDPQLTSRGKRDPLRVVVDSALRTPAGAKLLAPGVRRIIATTDRAAATRARPLELAGAEVWRLPSPDGRVALSTLLERLAADGVTTLLVEGGPTVQRSFLAAGLADEIRVYLAPLVIGDAARLKDAHALEFTEAPRRVGPDTVLVASVPGRK